MAAPGRRQRRLGRSRSAAVSTSNHAGRSATSRPSALAGAIVPRGPPSVLHAMSREEPAARVAQPDQVVAAVLARPEHEVGVATRSSAAASTGAAASACRCRSRSPTARRRPGDPRTRGRAARPGHPRAAPRGRSRGRARESPRARRRAHTPGPAAPRRAPHLVDGVEEEGPRQVGRLIRRQRRAEARLHQAGARRLGHDGQHVATRHGHRRRPSARPRRRSSMLPASTPPTRFARPGRRPSPPISHQARSVSATLHAWAMAAAGRKRRVAVEDLGDAAEPVVAQVMRHGQREARAAARSPCTRRWARANGPSSHPHAGALVIGAVALGRAAPVATRVSGIAGREAAQSEGGQEAARAGLHDASLPLGRERARGKRHRQDLVGPQRGVGARGTVDHVVAAPAASFQKRSKPAAARPAIRSHGRVGRPATRAREAHGAERIVPERVDLDGLAGARRHHPVADLRVHPRDLHAGLARAQEAVGCVHADAVARAPLVPADHVREHREQRLHQIGRPASPRDRRAPPRRTRARRRPCCTRRFAADRGSTLGSMPAIDEARERRQDVLRDRRRAGGKTRPGRATIVSRPQSPNQ